MARYAYPAVFTPEENGQFSVNFPDLESCYTCGDDMKDALIMAEDVLAFTLYGILGTNPNRQSFVCFSLPSFQLLYSHSPQ